MRSQRAKVDQPDHDVQSADRVDGKAFPAKGTLRERLNFALNYAVLAPSSHNTQPWRFIVQEQSVQVCADRTRALPVVDPYDRELIISCGAALFNLRVALGYFGEKYSITTFPYPADADVLAEVRVSADGFSDPDVALLLPAIRARATNRGPFTAWPMPMRVRDALTKAAAQEGAGIQFVRSYERRLQVAELVAEGDKRQFANAAFRRELASWLHGSRTDDGLPGYSVGAGELLNKATPIVSAAIRTFNFGDRVASSHHDLAAGSPLLLVLSTSRDDPESWLCAGQALERVLLVAAQAGYSASYLNQPIEVRALRPMLRALVESEKYPQVLLRIGRAKSAAVPVSPRRPLAAVVL
jgi:hypothetical protein